MSEGNAGEWHWEWSCRINRWLGGRADMPICARVHACRCGILRTLYLEIMDMAFFEPEHCARVARKWHAMQEQPITGRTKPRAGY